MGPTVGGKFDQSPAARMSAPPPSAMDEGGVSPIPAGVTGSGMDYLSSLLE